MAPTKTLEKRSSNPYLPLKKEMSKDLGQPSASGASLTLKASLSGSGMSVRFAHYSKLGCVPYSGSDKLPKVDNGHCLFYYRKGGS